MDFISSLLPVIRHFHMLGYWIALVVALLETTIGIGLFIPGSTTILLMGALASKGYFDLGDLLFFAIIGATIGDNINYFIGKKYGARIFSKGFWFIKPAHFKKGKDFFKRHGAKSVFLGRFVPSLKEVIPLIAGTFDMERIPFMLWNILGAIGWSLVWVLAGFFFAQSLNLAKMWLSRIGFFLAVLFITFILGYIFRKIIIQKIKKAIDFLKNLFKKI